MKKFFKILFSTIGIIFLCLLIIAEVMKNIARPTRERPVHKSSYVMLAPNKSEFARMVERADKEYPIQEGSEKTFNL